MGRHNILRLLEATCIGIAGLLLLLTPYAALLFGVASIIIAAFAFFNIFPDFSIAYCSVAWKVYIGGVLFTYVLHITYRFQNCCVGLQRFRDHIWHARKQTLLIDPVPALLWPLSWYMTNQALMFNEGRFWGDMVIDAFGYCFVGAWKGIQIEVFNFKTGDHSVSRSKNPKEDFQNEIRTLLN